MVSCSRESRAPWTKGCVCATIFSALKASAPRQGNCLAEDINFEIQFYFLRMLSFKKIQNGEKKLTGSELKKIKYHKKWAKILQKN